MDFDCFDGARLAAHNSMSGVQRRTASRSTAVSKAHGPAARLRVVALAADAFGGYGGIAQSTCDLMLALSSFQRIQSIDIVPRHAPDTGAELPQRIRQHRACAGRLKYTAAAWRTANSVQPHIVYCGHLFMIPLAAALAKMHNAKLMVHLHGLELWQGVTWLRQVGLNSVDLAFCVSHDTKNQLLQNSRVSADRIEVIFNTYSEVFAPGDRAKAREMFGLQDEKVLLTVSRLDATQRHKGHDRVIPLIPRLRALGHDIVYLIVGEGKDRKRLEALVCQHGVDDHVRFLGRVVPEKLPDLYRATNLYVMPSTGEGFGIAFVEAMACGTPALGLAIGGAPDALCDSKLGTAVSPDSFPEALEKFLNQEVSDPEELASNVQRQFGREVFQDRVHAALERVVG